ncbi:hypothetical protein [Kitasatospora sp. MAP5-34]|uniref:hypothetical protein n=1 Tax=Kitasatospora sp. MAP5-34 TaxID=3035102 RepID=UPI0024730531|nr:hypothetical protein [Kitasatospora sp. MAP5-34]MDH6576897.1 hypothetical protein [Kitasatospora sp. MAP5-34]
MALDSTTRRAGRQVTARTRLAALDARPELRNDGRPAWQPAGHLWETSALLGKVMDACTRPAGDLPEVGPDELGAALGLFEELRLQLDHLESQVIIEARRRGMDWRQIADEQGLNTPQAASQRYQRLMTRLEEIRLGVR